MLFSVIAKLYEGLQSSFKCFKRNVSIQNLRRLVFYSPQQFAWYYVCTSDDSSYNVPQMNERQSVS